MPAQDMTKDQLLAEIASLKEALTDQQHQIEQLRQSEKKFLSLFRDSAVGMAVVMPDGRFIQVNKAFCDFLGYSEPELLQKTILSITHPDDREASSQAIRQTFTSGPRIQHYEKRYLHTSGHVVWGEVTNTLISDVEGTPSYAIAQVLDITKRKLAEEALVERESQLLEAQEVADVGFYVLDLTTGRWLSSSVLNRILGISDEYERTIDGWANLVHPDERQKRQDYLLKEVVGEGKPCDHEYRIVRYEDQQVRWVHGQGRLRFNKDGQPGEMIGTIQDITERKRMERQLEEQAKQLADEARRKDEFLAMLAHELRNPLAPIRTGIDVLRILPPHEEEAKQVLDMMEEQAHSLVRLIDDLLDVSRVTRGKLELRQQRVALTTVITNAIQTTEPIIREHGQELTVIQARKGLEVHGDLTRLTQIVSNLLNNSAKYTPSGGKIWLTTDKIGDQAAIGVKDNGIGIASDVLPRIFEMFVQADNTLSRSKGGLGIGLTLVKNLVEMHGGTVEAASEGLGKGSEFTVRLPILQISDVTAQPTEFPVEPKTLPSYRILLVDDVQPAAFMVATLLRRWGQQVRTAQSGVEALAMIEQEKPDFILSDISMPEMSGYELAQAIRQRPEWNDIYLVAVTGYGQEGDKKQAKEAGFSSHIVKPITKDDLESLLVSCPYRR